MIQLHVAEKWGPDRIAGHLATVGDGSITIAPATVHRILMKGEWLYVRPYASDEERTAALADFLNTYNHERPQRAGEQASGQSGADHDVPPCTAVGELTPRIEGLGYEPTLFDLL